MLYDKTTNNIRIAVTPIFVGDQPTQQNHSNFVWAYHIVIENKGSEIVQLLSRYWNITDATGEVQEVEGPGVVGYQPLIRPGEFFEYTSGVNLRTDSGFMMGKYRMQYIDGRSFEVDIPAFSLDIPHNEQVLN